MHTTPPDAWRQERERLLQQRISELGLGIEGTILEPLVARLHSELRDRSLEFMPPVYLSDQWGCPDGTPLIGVPFYLADRRLSQIEEEESMSLEDELESMRYLRHEAGHAYNYAFRLHEHPDWNDVFGEYAQPYRDRYHVDPLSRDYVRHILGWYAQKHPDEDFAETFAVWLTPGFDWRSAYDGWPALRKLEFVDRLMRDLRGRQATTPVPTEDDLPVHAMQYTLAEHYEEDVERLPLDDRRQFDGDLRAIFSAERDGGEPASTFLREHRRELVARVSYWTAESPSVVRSLVDHLAARSEDLALTMKGREASTLIELTAFATSVMMSYRHTRARRAD